MKRYFYLSVILLLLLLSGVKVNLGQINEPVKRQKPPKYRIAESEYTVGENKVFLLFISINSKLLNREDMIALARKIKCDFPNENELQANFFTGYDAAKTFSINSGSKDYVRNMKAFKGGYYFNRISGKEYVSFSTIDKEPFDEEKIDLSKEKSTQCSSESKIKIKRNKIFSH